MLKTILENIRNVSELSRNEIMEKCITKKLEESFNNYSRDIDCIYEDLLQNDSKRIVKAFSKLK